MLGICSRVLVSGAGLWFEFLAVDFVLTVYPVGVAVAFAVVAGFDGGV